MGQKMNSGNCVRESIPVACVAERNVETFNRRTVNGPRPRKAENKSGRQRDFGRFEACAIWFAAGTKRLTPASIVHPKPMIRPAVWSNAQDSDDTFNKEFYR